MAEAENKPNEAEGAGSGPKKFSPKIILRILWSMVRRRWLLLGMAFVIALGVGAFASKPLTKKVWKATGVLLYTPPTIPEEVESLTDSVSLTNVSGLATSRSVLLRVKENLSLAFPVALLAKALKVETSRNSSTVFFSLNWGDKKEAQQVLEELVVIYPQYVTEVRQQIAQAMLDEIEQQVSNVKARQIAARDRYRDFTRANSIVDFKQDLVLMQAKVLGLETKMSQAKRDEQTMGDQVKMLDGHIKSIQKEEEAESQANSEFEAANETLADNRRRQNHLRELIAEERRVLDMKSQIEVKRREYERAKLLADKQLIPNSQLEKVRGELESLIAKITESEAIIKWKTELTELDKLVVPKNKVNKKGSPIIQQILFKKLETQLGIAQQQKAQIEIERELALTQKQIATFQRLRSELKTMEDDIEAIGKERLEVEGKASILRQLAGAGSMEFSVISPVSTGDFPVSSNRKMMFIGVVVVVLFMTGTSIAAFDVLSCGLIPPDVQVELMGLEIVSRRATNHFVSDDDDEEDEDSVNSETIREFALQLRQNYQEAGSVLMFSAMNESSLIPKMLEQLAECFAARDERVLIIDAQDSEDGIGDFADIVDRDSLLDQLCQPNEQDNLPGLRDWLNLTVDSVSQITLPTEFVGIDCILPGLHFSTEELATQRMSQLMAHARENYTMTILLSPDSTHKTELQILASHADGIVMAFEASNHVETATNETVKSLYAINAPILGAVEV